MSQFTQTVNTGMNDARLWVSGATWLNAQNSIYMGNDTIAFFRFTATGIGQGSTIDSAYFSGVGDWGGSSPLAVTVRAIDEDATNDFTADASGRSRTTASVNWNEASWTHDVTYTTGDIKSVIQEVIDRPGYSGGAIAIVIENNTMAYSDQCLSYEGDSTNAASIVINYTGTTTSYQTVSSGAKILNPTLDYGIIVAKSTYDAIADKDPSHHIFNSDYGTLKYFSSGSVSITLDTDYLANVESVEHNLGYIPFVEAYAQTTTAGTYQPIPYSGAGATVTYGVTMRITSTHIYFYAESTGFLAETIFPVKYFIFRNDLDL